MEQGGKTVVNKIRKQRMYWDINSTVNHSVLKADWAMGITSKRVSAVPHKLEQNRGNVPFSFFTNDRISLVKILNIDFCKAFIHLPL